MQQDSWRVVIITARHAPHSSAPPCAEIGRARDADRARTSSGLAVRDRLIVRHRPTGVPLRSQDGAASLELIHQQQFIVASQRGVIMRGRKRSGLWLPARTPDVVSHQDDAPIDADAQTDAALLALARLLARQAAREVFARTVTESDSSIDEGRELKSPSTPATPRTTNAKHRSLTSSASAASSRGNRAGRSRRSTRITQCPERRCCGQASRR